MVIRWGIIGLVLVLGGFLPSLRAYAATQDIDCSIQPYGMIIIKPEPPLTGE